MSFPLRCFYKYMSLSFLHKFHMIYGNASKMDFFCYLCGFIPVRNHIHSINKYFREPTRCQELSHSTLSQSQEVKFRNSSLLCLLWKDFLIPCQGCNWRQTTNRSSQRGNIPTNEGSSAAGHKTTKRQLSCLSVAPGYPKLEPESQISFSFPKNQGKSSYFVLTPSPPTRGSMSEP